MPSVPHASGLKGYVFNSVFQYFHFYSSKVAHIAELEAFQNLSVERVANPLFFLNVDVNVKRDFNEACQTGFNLLLNYTNMSIFSIPVKQV